ncbi:MAG: hypothetical protein ACPGU1_14440 [Myxococcota bacterium]
MSLAASLGRMSRRERMLVGLLMSLLVGAVVFVFYFIVGTEVSSLEERIDEDRETLTEIYGKSHEFLKATAATEAMREVAARNKDTNLKLAVNELAKRISFQSRNRKGEIEGTKKLADVMQFDQTQETYLSKKKKKKRKAKGKKKKDSDTGYYRRDQPITLSDGVPFKAIYELMEKIEETEELLFVTEMDLTRDFQDGRIARKNAQIVVSTYYYKGVEKAEKASETDAKKDG